MRLDGLEHPGEPGHRLGGLSVQRRHGVLGFPYAVVKKYGDDAGGREAALITFFAKLFRIFPLLLLGVAVLSQGAGWSSGPA